MSRDDYDDRPRRRGYDERDDDFLPPPRKSNAGLLIGILAGVFLAICGGGGFLVWQMVRAGKAAVVQAQAAMQQAQNRARADADTVETRENLSRLGSALSRHEANNQRFPNDTYSPIAKGNPPTLKPLLSWRVHLLPTLGEEGLYRQFKLDEPWDSPHNRPLVERMPDVYGSPADQVASGPGRTFYRGFCHQGAVFERPRQPGQPNWVTKNGITDGLSTTLAVVVAVDSIEWTRPDEWDWSPGKPRPRFGGPDPTREFFLALTADGQVHRVRSNVTDKTLRALIHRADDMPIVQDWEAP